MTLLCVRHNNAPPCCLVDTSSKNFCGAGRGTRTLTLSPAPDFESGASTNSAIPARRRRIIPETARFIKLGSHGQAHAWRNWGGLRLFSPILGDSPGVKILPLSFHGQCVNLTRGDMPHSLDCPERIKCAVPGWRTQQRRIPSCVAARSQES